ncbi:hypothetical protein TNCV_3001091 [Trichonephila clavipes]|nr:hypothetical protein TNCV_3001091 [Trichonephila clavipes]
MLMAKRSNDTQNQLEMYNDCNNGWKIHFLHRSETPSTTKTTFFPIDLSSPRGKQQRTGIKARNDLAK